jgi:hypothetical protein
VTIRLPKTNPLPSLISDWQKDCKGRYPFYTKNDLQQQKSSHMSRQQASMPFRESIAAQGGRGIFYFLNPIQPVES